MKKKKENKSGTLGDLRPSPRNPRTISKEQLEALGASLEEFGDLSGFVVNRTSGNIVGGHQRQKVLPADSKIVIKEKFLKPSRVGTVALGTIEVDGESFHYREVEWNDEKEIAANIAANQHGGVFDMDAAAVLVKALGENYNFKLLGFDEATLRLLRTGKNDDDNKGALLEKLKVTIDDPTTKVEPGQVWRAGRHVVVCEDVFSGWKKWVPLLVDDALCLPYAGPLVLLTAKAKTHTLVVINPDPYICGHVLDSYIAATGEKVAHD